MNYTLVSTVAENCTSFPSAVGSNLNNESNFLKIKFIVESNNVVLWFMYIAFLFWSPFYGIYLALHQLPCFREVTFTFI